MNQIKLYGLAALLSLPLSAAATVELPEIISDNMVLQQQSDARLWGWATPGSVIEITGSWAPAVTVSTVTNSDGRWDAMIPTAEASYTPYQINVKGDGSDITLDNILLGEVWFCSGQSNMEMPLRGFWTQPVEGSGEAIAYSGMRKGVRMATVPKLSAYTPQERTQGSWKISNPANSPEFSALAYFYACTLNDLLDVPVGIISCSYGGSKVEGWQSREQLVNYPECDIEKEKVDTTMYEFSRINVMYNAMLHPLIGYTIKGFVWNQGESNVGLHDTYPQHQLDMVTDWREKWGQGELPFYFVEIPAWIYSGADNIEAALFRECQHHAAEILPNSGIISTADLIYPHELYDIHGSRKKEIGERLAFLAAARTYGIEGMPVDNPSFRSMTIDGEKAILSFYNTALGFMPRQNMEGFEAAGEDGVFQPAVANQDPRTLQIIVTCSDVPEIKAVRYNFKNFSVGKVFNTLGLPLIPFRTDR